ncbi:hypothetical protein LZ24_00450 [Desulfobotulus alkaliphilus]|uniref:Uncharacterized protein n=1 Tax=Desulfobotulus alkaliphilus TaxID=622671 RepID=A0A562S6K6_9BACT|nr:hypothetical protein [Desulfobotulus alkaliphilus]TWI76828.1 hypothetical protein LZ24_00450 [Desulfobotulus alkaliphilus]
MDPSGYSPFCSGREGKMLNAVRLFFQTPRPAGSEVEALAADVFGYAGVGEAASLMVSGPDEASVMLKDLWMFPDRAFRQGLVDIWGGRGWEASGIRNLCTALFQEQPFARLDTGGVIVDLPLSAAEISHFVGRLCLHRHMAPELLEEIRSIEPLSLAMDMVLTLWTSGMDVLEGRAEILKRLVAKEKGNQHFSEFFNLMVKVMAEAPMDVPWPQPLLHARRRLEQRYSGAKRVAAALERGTMETLLLSGDRVLDADPERVAEELYLAESLLHSLWPGALPWDAGVQSREFDFENN